jgi:hypothetical protein
MPVSPSLLQRFFQRVETLLLCHGTEPKTIFWLAVFSVMDGFLPMLPAEMFVLAFAVASALSAFLLALGMGTLTASAESLSQKLMGSQGPQVLAMLRDSGPVSMVFFSIFPDSPRSAIALFALSGVSPESIGAMVFIGKLMLYTVLLWLIHHLPSRVGRWRGAGPFWVRWLQRRASRFVAYCRRIRWRAKCLNPGA